MTKPILIAAAGRTFPGISAVQGDFDDWIAAGLGAAVPVSVQDVRTSPSLPPASELAGLVITGSHSMVSDREPWSEQLAGGLRALVEAGVPVLGICFGHQLLAHAFGGRVDYHPDGIEIGTARITLTPEAATDALLGTSPASFAAQLVHRQSVLTLPQQAVCLARGAFEPHQAFRIGDCAWGVQFHPEFSARAMRSYIAEMRDQLVGQGRDADALADGVCETPHAAALLPRFAALSLAGS